MKQKQEAATRSCYHGVVGSRGALHRVVLENGRLVDGVGVLVDDLEVALLLILRGSGELDGLGLGHLLFFKHLLLVD